MNNFQPQIAVIEKNDGHYNPWLISKMKKPAIIYIDADDNIIFISLYSSILARKTNPSYDKHWWCKYNVVPIECRQDGENVLFVLYNEDGTPKETDGEFELPEAKYKISYVDEYDERSETAEIIDEYKLYDTIRDYVIEEADKECPYRYHKESVDTILNLPNKMIVENTKTNKSFEISYYLVNTVANDIADKNNGFATVGDISEELFHMTIDQAE